MYPALWQPPCSTLILHLLAGIGLRHADNPVGRVLPLPHRLPPTALPYHLAWGPPVYVIYRGGTSTTFLPLRKVPQAQGDY